MYIYHPGPRAAVPMLLLPVMVLMFSGSISAGTIGYQFSDIGSNSYRYSFILSSIQFEVNQQLEIRFADTVYLSLSNGVAGKNFNLTLLQPGNPLGTFGDYTAVSLVNNPSLAGPFSVDVKFTGAVQPGSLPFVINQLDANGTYLSTLESGSTIAAAAQVPEPASSFLAGTSIFASFFCVVSRRARRARQVRPVLLLEASAEPAFRVSPPQEPSRL